MEIKKIIKKINNDYPENFAMDFDNMGLIQLVVMEKFQLY